MSRASSRTGSSGYNLGSWLNQVAAGVSNQISQIDGGIQSVAQNLGGAFRSGTNSDGNGSPIGRPSGGNPFARPQRQSSSSSSSFVEVPTPTSSHPTTPEEPQTSRGLSSGRAGSSNPFNLFMGNAGICGRSSTGGGGGSGGSVSTSATDASSAAAPTSASGQHRTPQAASSPDLDPNQRGLLCDNCNVKFSLFSRKRECPDCRQFFCDGCFTSSHAVGSGGASGAAAAAAGGAPKFKTKICERCLVLSKHPPVRADLMELRVIDLKRYLTAKKISMKNCVEKKDLVELVVRENGGGVETHAGSFGQRASRPSGSRVGPLEKPQQSFPKSYVQSTHRQEWFDNMAMGEVEQDGDVTAAATSRRHSDSSGSGRETERPDVTPVVELLLPDRQEEDTVTTTPVVPMEPPGEEHDSGKSEPAGASGSLEPMDLPPMEVGSDDPPLSSSLPARDSSHLNPVSSASGQTANTLRPNQIENTKSSSMPSSPKRFANQGLVHLSDLRSLEDLQELSVKQCKEILALNRVNFKGVVEKDELLKILERLWKQEQKLKEGKDEMGDDELCKICMDNPVDCVMLECGHMCTCTGCGKLMNECPICRQYVVRVVKIFKA